MRTIIVVVLLAEVTIVSGVAYAGCHVVVGWESHLFPTAVGALCLSCTVPDGKVGDM